MTTECVSGNGSSRFKIFPEEVKEKAVFAEHLPLRETELFHKLPVVIIGHIILPSDSDPTEELGAHYGLLRSKFKNCLSIKPTLAMSLQKCQRSSHLAGIPNDKAVFAFASLTCLMKKHFLPTCNPVATEVTRWTCLFSQSPPVPFLLQAAKAPLPQPSFHSL